MECQSTSVDHFHSYNGGHSWLAPTPWHILLKSLRMVGQGRLFLIIVCRLLLTWVPSPERQHLQHNHGRRINRSKSNLKLFPIVSMLALGATQRLSKPISSINEPTATSDDSHIFPSKHESSKESPHFFRFAFVFACCMMLHLFVIHTFS